jgi:hypothetical protein
MLQKIFISASDESDKSDEMWPVFSWPSVKGEVIMKKLLSLLVATVMVLGMIVSIGILPVSNTEAADVKDVTMIAAVWNRVGYDRFGRPLFNGQFTTYNGVSVNINGRFTSNTTATYDAISGVYAPWQSKDGEVWGRVGYAMPNCLTAISDRGLGRYNDAVTTTSPAEWSVTPYLYTEVFLTVKAKGGESQLFDKRYVIMDNMGVVWIDPDGKFNDCRFWQPADPASVYYRSTVARSGDGSSSWNDCSTNPKMMVDPSGGNNTQGPYIFNPNYNVNGTVALPAPRYHARVYYWWWDEDKNIDRVWRLGWANMTDYLRRDAFCADGVHRSSGIVGGPDGTTPNAYYPGKPVLWNSQIGDPVSQRWTANDANIIAFDWDANTTLSNFTAQERFIDNNPMDGIYQPGEPIFLDSDNNGFDPGDARLVSYTIQWGGRAVNFRENTTVTAVDEDLLWFTAGLVPPATLASVQFTAIPPAVGFYKHANVTGINAYEQIYNDLDNDNTVDPGEIRISNINYRTNGFGPSSGFFFMGDVFIMLEVLKTSCEFNYNIHVQSDLWTGMQEDTYQNPELIPSRTVAAFKSPNGDINSMAQLINKATTLDVDGKSLYMPTTTFFDVKALYREYLGIQIFCDNGIDNNMAQGGRCYSLSLADDHVNFEAGELFVGATDVETAMDFNLPLTDIPAIFYYYETAVNMAGVPADLTFVEYGCGEPIYKDLNRLPLFAAAPLQEDYTLPNYNPPVVNAGDQRMTDITVSATGFNVAQDKVTYKAGSIVTPGDLDVGRPLTLLEAGMVFHDESQNCEPPNKTLDVGEYIYWDPTMAGASRAVRMLGGPGFTGPETFTTGLGNFGNTTNRYAPAGNTPFTSTNPNRGGAWRRYVSGYIPDPATGNFNYFGYNNQTVNISGTQFNVANPYDNRCMYDQYVSWGMPIPYPASNDGAPMGYENDWQPNRLSSHANDAGTTAWGAPGNWYSGWITSYFPSSAMLMYQGLDTAGNPASTWDSYSFNFDYEPNTNNSYTGWYFYMGFTGAGIAGVYLQSTGSAFTGYGLYWNYTSDDYGYPTIGLPGADETRLYLVRYTSSGNYSSMTPIDFRDFSGDRFSYQPQSIRTTVMGNQWRVTIPSLGPQFTLNLTGGNTNGSVGFPNWTNQQSYYDNYNEVYWDNADVFYMQFVPSSGDRRRMTNPGHWVGQNNYVMRKNAEDNISTSSTSAKSEFRPFGYWYPCGTKLTAGEIYDVESRIGMVTMGQNGDPRFMDIEVLPGKVKVNIDIDGKPVHSDSEFHLKVEQTSDVRISVDPPPAPGEKYVVKATDVFQSGITASPARTDYVETAEANSFTEYERNEIPIPKESFSTIYGLGHWYGYIVTDCNPQTGSGGFPEPRLALPFNFPFYDTVVPQGTHIQAYVSGYLTFDNLQTYCGAAGSYPYPGATWGWFTQAPNWVIAPCAIYYQSLGSSPLWPPVGDYPINPNLNMFVATPTANKIKIRWATCYEYDYPNYPYPWRSTPVNVAQYNYSVTLDSSGTIRFSYGEYSGNGPNWYQACVGIKRTGTNFHQAVHHAKIAQELSGADDVVLTLTNFPPDPGRPSGGTIEGNYMVGTAASSLDAGAQNVLAGTALGRTAGNISAKVIELTNENPIQHFQVTPYRGSCQPDGSRDPYKIEVFLERGGLTYPVPMDSVLSGERLERPMADYENVYDDNIYDPYWVARPWTIKQYDNRYPGDKTPLPVPSPSGIPTYSCALDDQYDCWGRFNLNVAPEDLKLVPNRCLSPLDLRYPNLVLKVFDGDNPLDINDPANLPISTTTSQAGIRSRLIANVNATGAGIKYLCMSRNPQGDDYIIQVNSNGSYNFWRLYEPQGNNAGAAEGVLDPSDWLFSNRDNTQQGADNPANAWSPTRLPFQDTDGYVKSLAGADIGTELDDRDCSIGKGLCDVCHLGEGFPRLGDVTPGDRMGRFNGIITDANTPFMQGYQFFTHGTIQTFGVRTLITNWTSTDTGGEIMVPIQPQNAETDVKIRVYLDNTIYDYNSALATLSINTNDNPTIHPPYFIYDDAPGIDYCGVITVPVTPASDLNFSEFRFVDNALRSSRVNYTAGTGALSAMDRPTPQIMSWYDPICYNNKRDCVVYPGGQSHVQRAVGTIKKGGFNAYPAINQSLWRKMGTEFYPMTDYSMYFALTAPNDTFANQQWDQYGFNTAILQQYPQLQYLVLRSIEISGPFITPYQYTRPEQLWDGSTRPRLRLTSEYSYNGVKNVPIKYDFSGKVIIDSSNYQSYEFTQNGNWWWPDGDWTNIIDPATDFEPDRHSRLRVGLPANGKLRQKRDLVYNPDSPYIPMQIGMYNGPHYSDVFVIDGIIPIQPGNIEVKVTLDDGSVKIYQDCCQNPPTDGIDVHALKIQLGNEDIEQSGKIFVDKEVTFNVKLTEDEKALAGDEWLYKECNDALVYAWQDRGVYDPDRKIWDGAGDGWCSNPPKSSDFLNQGVQFAVTDDKNRDNKIAFANGETEIIGTYDFATNTWYGSFIDARTFQRNDGIYNLPVSTDTVGFDFGGIGTSGRPLPPGFRDHIIAEDETLPVWIVAYKYGDDDNDRSFRPLYNGDPNGLPEHSHEVYMAGTRAFEVAPNIDLQVTYGPEPLTAGMTPELQDPSKPLTFTVKDSIGKDVDLTRGIKDGFGVDTVILKDMQMHLFADPHPDNSYYHGKGAKLPQYYWLRTDLQNYSIGLENNMYLYSVPNDPFTPIVFTKNEGNYIFKGFCANDQGEFDVYVYTPDRKHCGMVTVKVKQPHVEYEVKNVESGQIFNVRGNNSTSANAADPDFVMTALDNRLYNVTVTAWDAQGSLIKGIAQDVSVCSGSGQDTARFTPYITRPKQWDMAYGGGMSSNPGVAEYTTFANYMTYRREYFMVERNESQRFRPMLGIDINNDGKINPILKVNDELHLFNAMGLVQSQMYGSPINMGLGTGGIYKAHYNTTNYRYDDYSYELQGAWDIGKQSPVGWGYGAIYNHPYKGGYVFADLNGDTILTFQDSLSFNQNGKISFFFYADDVLDLGGLVGNNAHSNDAKFCDVYGSHLIYLKNDPNYMRMRFRHSRSRYGQGWWGTNDNSYKLDWEAIPDNDLTVRGPIVKVFDPGTGEEAPKELINPEHYDLTWAVNNHFIARVYPADPRDEKMKSGTRLTVLGEYEHMPRNQSTHEHEITGVLLDSEVDPKAIETSMTMMPTGTGQFQESLWFENIINWHKRYNNIDENINVRPTNANMNFVAQLAKFDVAKGLSVKAEPYNKVLKLGQPDTVLVTVTEAGSGYRYEGAKVTMKSEDGAINLEGKTNQAGEVNFTDVKPDSDSKIIIKATLEGRVTGNTVLYVGIDLTPPSINLGAIPGITNKKTLAIDGDVTKGSTLKVGTVNATVDENGKWKATINLTEGENLLNVVAVGPNGAIRAITIKITLDTTPPKVTLPTDEEFLAQIIQTGKFILSGRVEPGSDVKVSVSIGGNSNKYNVTVVNDFWTIQDLPATPGQVDVIVDATDAAGNVAAPALTKSYMIPKITTLKLVVGNTIKIFNGKLGTMLIVPPAVSTAGMPMIPVEEIQDIGFTFTPGNTMTFKVGSAEATCTIGSTVGTLNGNPFTLSEPPVLSSGKALVPASFFEKVLAMNTKAKVTLTYEPAGRVILIRILE